MLKTVAIEIEVKSPEEVGREMDEIAARIKRGDAVKKTNKIVFPNLDVARKILSPERLRILAAIEEKHPKSMYQLAALVGRDRRNVVKDVEYLASIGLIKLTKEKRTRKLTIPLVNFNKINIGIDLRRFLSIPTPT